MTANEFYATVKVRSCSRLGCSDFMSLLSKSFSQSNHNVLKKLMQLFHMMLESNILVPFITCSHFFNLLVAYYTSGDS